MLKSLKEKNLLATDSTEISTQAGVVVGNSVAGNLRGSIIEEDPGEDQGIIRTSMAFMYQAISQYSKYIFKVLYSLFDPFF